VPCIAVVGAGRDASPGVLAAAEEAGAAIAAAGATLVCGGLGGVMEAACRGARSRGGLTVGLLPGSDRMEANGWVVLALPTGLGEGRNALIVRAADAVVAIGGGWGTLSEIALALRRGLPVLGVETWELARRRAGRGRARGRRRGDGGGRGAAARGIASLNPHDLVTKPR
jgi:uncharacterized protein (TIGR00725 family)